jgi:hypothetical protein
VKFWLSRKEEVKTLSHGKPKRAKRGVGTIIGAAFIIMILLSGFAFYSLILNNIDSYNKSASEANASELNRNHEQLIISSIQITSESKLNLTVKNTGSVSSKLLWLGLFNQSVVPEWQQFFPLNEQIEPAETTNITSDFVVTKDQKYVIQITTEAGNIFSSRFYPASEVTCALTLVAAPPTVYQGSDIALFLTVTHNDTEIDIIQNITVSLQTTPSSLVTLKEQPSSLTIESLGTGETAFFKWIYEATNTGTVAFNATYNQAPVGTFALSTVNITTAPADGAQGQVTITGKNASATFNPSQWTALGGTQYVSGLISDLTSSDSNPVVFSSYYTGASTDTNDFVDTNTSNVDGSPSKGTHSNFAAQQVGPDSIYDMLTETGSTSTNTYNPSSYNLLGSTQLVSGTLTNLQTNNGVYITFRSYQSASTAQLLYAHSETTTIGGSPYYLQRLTSADGTATTLSASMGTVGRQLFGKFVYPLTGVASIPASTWTVNYRAWQDATTATVTFDSASSVEAATPATSVSWSHTTGTASNRLLVVAVSVHAATGTPTTVSSVTYGGAPLTQVTTALYSVTAPQVRTYIFRLLNPQSGTQTITVNFAASTLYVCGATTYANVDQSAPIQTFATATGSSTSPSVPVTVTGTGSAVFGQLAGHRTSSQVTFQAAGDGSGTTGNPTPNYPSGLQTNDLILLQVTVRDTTNIPTTPTGFTLLYGPDYTDRVRQWIYYKFATGSESGTITINIGGNSGKTARMYTFRNVDPSSFTEGENFGSGTQRTIYAQSVTTTDTNRLAVSFVFVSDDNAVDSFTGETGGDWTEAAPEFTTSAGSDGTIQLQTATMASVGTISGGSYYMSNNDRWGVRAFALKPIDWVITEGSGQNNRWAKETYLYKGRGSDKLNVAAGTVTMSWSTNYAPNWVCSAVVINPVSPVGYCSIDALIRKSDGTIRSSIATNVANSSALSSTATTLSGTYSWGAYSVVDQTDYLEIDYYVNVASAVPSANAYLRIDDNTLSTTDQTRAANVMLPSEYTVEVEFFGTSDTETWAHLVWAIDNSFTTSGVTATFQLYNYTSGAYSTIGDGYMTDTIGTTDITKTQTITVNPTQLKDASGNWRLKVKGVKTTTSQFNWQGDLMAYTPSSVNYELDLEVQWASVDFSQTNEWLCIYGGTMAAENIRVDVWTGSDWQNVFTNLASGWNNVSISAYLTSLNFTIRFNGGTEISDTVQSSWNIDVTLLHLWTIANQHTAEVEFTGSPNVQNWTSFTWSIRSSWGTEQVSVAIQFYNFTLGAYVTSGEGYLAYTSSATPNTYELKTQNVAAAMEDFTNSSGNWKVKITGVKATAQQFLMNVDLIESDAGYISSGENISYGAWQWYTIKATSAGGAPIPYSYISIYANGTNLTLYNAVTNTNITNTYPIPNPNAWVQLDASGEYQLYLKSTSTSSETFVLYVSVGTSLAQKEITQEP